MLTRIATVLTVLAALGQPALAGPDETGQSRQQATSRQATIPILTPPSTDDIRAGRIGHGHARALRQIAIDEAIGNRDGAEMLKAQLRATGLGRDSMRDAVTWAKVHGTKVHEGRPFPKLALPVVPDVKDETAAKTMY